MKRIAIIAAALLAVSAPSFAQQRVEVEKAQVYASYGYLTLPDVGYAFAAVLGTAFTGGYAKASKVEMTGGLSVGVDVPVSRMVSLGALATCERVGLQFDSYSGKDEEGHMEYQEGRMQYTGIVALMPAIKFTWARRECVSWYSRAAAGMSVFVSDETRLNPAGQLTLIGLDFGRSHLKGFVELGAGFQGACLGGIKYSF